MATEAEEAAAQVEDEVLNTLTTLGAEELEEICTLLDIEVEETYKGKRARLVKLVMASLCVLNQDKTAEFLLVHNHLQLNNVGDEEDGEDDKTNEVA